MRDAKIIIVGAILLLVTFFGSRSTAVAAAPGSGSLKILLYNTERNDAHDGDSGGCPTDPNAPSVPTDYTRRKISTFAQYIKDNQIDIALLQELWHRCGFIPQWDEATLLGSQLQSIGYPMEYRVAHESALFRVGTFINPSTNLSFDDAGLKYIMGNRNREYLLTPINTPIGKISFLNGHVSHRGNQCSNVQGFVDSFSAIPGDYKVGGGDMNNVLESSGCAGVRDNYKLIPRNGGLDFLFTPNTSPLSFEGTYIDNLLDPGRGTIPLSDHLPIVTILTGPLVTPALNPTATTPVYTPTPIYSPTPAYSPTPSLSPTPSATPQPTIPVCNLCGYCKGGPIPIDYDDCMQCTYGIAPDINAPDAQQLPATREGYNWTVFGCSQTSVGAYTQQIYNLALIFSGSIAFLVMLYGGFIVLTSSGDPWKLRTGRKLVTNAAIASLIIIFAVVLLQTSGSTILKLPGF